MTIETLSKIKKLDLQVQSEKAKSVTVAMGQADVGADTELLIDGNKVHGTPVSAGNPHFVIFVQDIEEVSLRTLGPLIEKHAAFPNGVNVEFVQRKGDSRLRMRVWERGSGVTLACGTGACASAAAVSRGYFQSGDPISVELDGRTLEIKVDKQFAVTMKGPAESLCEGEAAS